MVRTTTATVSSTKENSATTGSSAQRTVASVKRAANTMPSPGTVQVAMTAMRVQTTTNVWTANASELWTRLAWRNVETECARPTKRLSIVPPTVHILAGTGFAKLGRTLGTVPWTVDGVAMGFAVSGNRRMGCVSEIVCWLAGIRSAKVGNRQRHVWWIVEAVVTASAV